MDTIIVAKQVSKKYRIGDRYRYLAFRDILSGLLKAPFNRLRAGSKKDEKKDFWSLQDIHFEVRSGEVLGIIGKNGAGKSTLLKILSQITPPTTGEIKIKGRVGSLLEVGTGFHPELTGRENIYLNGAILGMRKKEIEAKFDEIVEFSGVKDFLDIPVKRYSSGMYVRLAFAVAAHLDPEILIIDEVLAVGDAEFQKKCLQKMEDITQEKGRTILFVSHNMEAVKRLCHRTIVLDKGRIIFDGETHRAVEQYLNIDTQTSGSDSISLTPKREAVITFRGISLWNSEGKPVREVDYTQDFFIQMELDVKGHITNAEISVTIRNSKGFDILCSSLSDNSEDTFYDFNPGTYTIKVGFQGKLFMPDQYYITVNAHYPGLENIDIHHDALSFRITQPEYKKVRNYGIGCVIGDINWNVDVLKK